MAKKRRLLQQRLNEQFKKIQEEIDQKAMNNADKRMRKRTREEQEGGGQVQAMEVNRKKSRAKPKKSKRDSKSRRRMERLQSWKKQNFESSDKIVVDVIENSPLSGTKESTEVPHSKRHRSK
ncbi:hypothetical protein XU18_1022 [Perkinsela sp. CCAP 1560/4]|nr:hypothetical protein XU18_1022 [Perkinsela sp. CCAP 1560/4]|eukprot:KNH08453.1 hypothetical protein XU18_1022 [Perkinsela sp. CCAP 1560/4]